MGCGSVSKPAAGAPGVPEPHPNKAERALPSHPDEDKASDDLIAGWEANEEVDAMLDEALGSEDSAIGSMEKVLSIFGRMAGNAAAAPNQPVDVQSLSVGQLSAGQRALIRHSALGQVLVDGASQAIAAMPFGAPVAALLSAVYGRSIQTVKNSRNCNRLLNQIKLCDRQLARATLALQKKQGGGSSSSDPPGGHHQDKDLTQAMRTIMALVKRAAVCISRYSARGCLMAFVSSTSDQAQFKVLEEELHKAMVTASFAMAVEAMSAPSPSEPYTDESDKLRQALCKAAGLPVTPESAQQALEQLQRDDPIKLQKLLQTDAPFSTQVLTSELAALAERVTKLEADMEIVQSDVRDVKGRQDKVEVQVAGLLAMIKLTNQEEERRGPACLEPWLKLWWSEQDWMLRVSREEFLNTLVEWLTGLEDGPRVLKRYDKALLSEKLILEVSSVGEGAQLFLRLVVTRYLDEDGDGVVTLSELNKLQRFAFELTKRPDLPVPPPQSMLELLDLLFMGFDRALMPRPEGSVVDPVDVLRLKVQAALKVTDAISSYKLSTLLDDYVDGSRGWLYDRVDQWLDEKPTPSSADKGGDSQGTWRMLLLLADAGMGKSVFSAVMHMKLRARLTSTDKRLVMAHHFFKVGQPSASGKTMILCLAHQLAKELPDLAALLEPVLDEHGDAANLSLMETCDAYLVQPLLELHRNGKLPDVLLLLDALDEAEGGSGRGWQPVAALIARELLKLPSKVRVLLTGRPEVEPWFKAWPITPLVPLSADNEADLRLVVRDRLMKRALVQGGGGEVEEAVNVIVSKSKGQFVFLKYAFAELSSQKSWTAAQLQSHLPSGLAGAFSLALGGLQAALAKEKPALLQVLREGVLPVLVAARELLTTEQVAWLAGAKVEQVDELLDYAASLFPRRVAGADGQLRVTPYHKSVLDWLTNDPKADWLHPPDAPGPQFKIDPATGHALAGRACQVLAMTLQLSDPKAPYVDDKEVEEEEDGEEGHVPPAAQGAPKLNGNQAYAVRHAMAHICLAKDVSRLEQLAFQFGFWEHVHAAGHGVNVLKDLLQLGEPLVDSCAVLRDLLRWLRSVGPYLAKHPRATLQLACDAPTNSLISRHACGLPIQPRARLLSKAQDWGACIQTLQGHTGRVDSMVLSPDGCTIITSASEDIRVWDLASGELKGSIEASGRYQGIAISSDGRSIVTGHHDHSVKVWDLASGESVHTLKWWCDYDTDTVHDGHDSVVACVATGPGTMLLSGSQDYTVRMWDMASGECVGDKFSFPDQVDCMAVSPDGRHMAVYAAGYYGGSSIRLHDLTTREHTHNLHDYGMEKVTCIAFSPDAKTLFSGHYSSNSGNSGMIRVWDLQTNEPNSESNESVPYSKSKSKFSEYKQGTVHSVAVSPDGRTLLSACADNTIRIWDMVTKALQIKLEGHTEGVNSVAFHPGGKIFVSASDDKTIKVWDLSYTQRHQSHQSTLREAKENSVAVSADCQTIVCSNADGSLMVWKDIQDTNKRSSSRRMKGKGSVWKMQPQWKEHHPAKGEEVNNAWVKDLNAPEHNGSRLGGIGEYRCVAVSSEGNTIACAHGNAIRVWGADACKDLQYMYMCDLEDPGMEQATCLAFIDRGATLISSHARSSLNDSVMIRVWNVFNGVKQTEVALSDVRGVVGSLAVSPDGKTVVTGCSDNTVRVVDLASGDVRLLGTHDGPVTCVAFGDAGKYIISGSEDTTIRLWCVATGEVEKTLRGHLGTVTSVAMPRDGDAVLSGSEDKTIKVWRMWTMDSPMVDTWKASGGGMVRKVAYAADGRTRMCIDDSGSANTYTLSERTWNDEDPTFTSFGYSTGPAGPEQAVGSKLQDVLHGDMYEYLAIERPVAIPAQEDDEDGKDTKRKTKEKKLKGVEEARVFVTPAVRVAKKSDYYSQQGARYWHECSEPTHTVALFSALNEFLLYEFQTEAK